MKKELEALLKDVGTAYDESDIKKQIPGLNYSLITGSLQKGQPLIIGFNWGGGCMPPQLVIEEEDFCQQELGSMKKIIPFCKERFVEGFLDKANQTNYCFFRSKDEKVILPDDLKLCEPIFDKLVTLLEPSVILCFSSQLRKYLCDAGQIRLRQDPEKKIIYMRGGKEVTCHATKGLFNEVKIAFLPHPNSRIPGKTKHEAWDFAVGST